MLQKGIIYLSLKNSVLWERFSIIHHLRSHILHAHQFSLFLSHESLQHLTLPMLHKLAQVINLLQIIFHRFNFFSLQLHLNQLRTKTVCLLMRKTQFKRAFSKLYIRNYVATNVHIISVSHLKSTELQAQFSLQITP